MPQPLFPVMLRLSKDKRERPHMSEIARVLQEFNVLQGNDVRLNRADNTLIQDALREYGAHLLECSSTVRLVKPVGVDRRGVCSHLDSVAARANHLASLIDISASVIVEKCGEG